MTADATPAILFWVQHLLGIGHFARTAALAGCAAARGYAAHIAVGGTPVPGAQTGGVTLHPLPALHAADETFSGLVNDRGAPAGEADWRARGDRLATLLETIRPRLVVLEHYPFGRRAFGREIAALLDRAGASGVLKVAVSVRDILVDRKAERWAEAADFIERRVDRVFVHGDPDFIALDDTFPLAARIAAKLHYTGYVDPLPAEAEPEAPAPAEAEILVSSGGGRVGAALRAAALALGSGPNGEPVRIRAGGAVPAAEFEALRSSAGPQVTVERNRPDFRRRLAGCACSVSQAGYNTVVDILKSAAPSVLVPFDTAGETEQMRRARRLEAMERAVVLPEDALTPHRLKEAVAGAQALPRRSLPVRLDGAEAFVRALPGLIGAPA
ncbi:MAG: glycosyltransferase [Rhodospirillaceae bacterium]|nr:glycosyltransferase [Rhodospirillaceae bacterium]